MGWRASIISLLLIAACSGSSAGGDGAAGTGGVGGAPGMGGTAGSSQVDSRGELLACDFVMEEPGYRRTVRANVPLEPGEKATVTTCYAFYIQDGMEREPFVGTTEGCESFEVEGGVDDRPLWESGFLCMDTHYNADGSLSSVYGFREVWVRYE